MSNTPPETFNYRPRVLFVPSGGIDSLDQLGANDTLLRCEYAFELWKTGNYDSILVCGGLFLSPNVQSIAAGILMRRWFIDQGVDPSRIVVESKSLDTFQNVTLSMKTLAGTGLRELPEITVVTQWQHALRFWITFYSLYGLRIRLKPMRYFMSWKAWFLEFAMISYHLADPTGTGKVARENREKRTLAAASK